MKPTIENFKKLEGEEVVIYYIHLFGNTAKRKGRLELDSGWAYVYDKDKSGQEYNGAFHIEDPEELKEIVGLELIEKDK